MTDAYRLYERHDLAALQAMLQEQMDAPENRNPPGCVFIYTKRAQRKMDAIAEAISMHLKDRKIANGTYQTEGYSGRNSNRR